MVRALQSGCVIVAVLFATLNSISSFAQPSDEETIKEEVALAFDRYLSAIAESRWDTIANDVYTSPSYDIGNETIVVRATKAEIVSDFEAIGDSLEPSGFDRIEPKNVSICVMNRKSAILSVVADYVRSDGSIVIGDWAGSYLFAKLSEGWRIVTFMAHRPDKIIQCAE